MLRILCAFVRRGLIEKSDPNEPAAMRGGPIFEFIFGLDTQLRQEGRRERVYVAGDAGMLVRRTESNAMALPPLRLMHGVKAAFESWYLRRYR